MLASHRGQPVAGLVLATDGRSNTGEDPLRAVEAAVRQNIPIYAIAAGADEGPRNVRLAEIEASPVVFARDPMTLAVVVEARGLRDAEATVVLERRVNEGDWEPVGNQRDRARARTASSSGRRSGSSPRSSASTSSAPASRTPARS